MKVLIACEESGIVREAFKARGHDTWSCDLLPTATPGHHLQLDVKFTLKEGWDLMIAHPPCTFVSAAGCRWLFPKGKLNQERYQKGLKAKEFFMQLLDAPIPKKCIENPYPHKVFDFPKETQIIQPYQFGHPVQKKTLLWLKNIPKLQTTKIVEPEFMRDGKGIRHSKWFMEHYADPKARSKTFQGIADAMAAQWG